MTAALETALRTKILTATNIATNAPGGVHNSARPQGSSFPVVVFQLVSGLPDQPSFGGDGVEALRYDVRVIAPLTDQTKAAAALAAIHAVLERGVLAISGGAHLQTMRFQRLPMMREEVGGVVYLTRGSTYTIWAS